MIHLTARLLPDTQTEQLLTETLAEFTRCCRWAHERAPVHALDMHMIRRLLYNELRHQTELGGMLCNLVFSVVAGYRRAVSDLGTVQGDISPHKLIYYSNSLTIKGQQVSLLLLGGRVTIPFDMPKPEDYRTLKAADMRRADLTKAKEGWSLDLQLAPREIFYSPEAITFAAV
ncbi:MAG: hypothetical protein CVV27_08465 [Candidatus Melainabacteria bacterium HGW-Melainabacteria-1]|nr:MAG: hypothetical protein CVV27_08465 [Candidatus Melainabacteria bacterium HGW-Melainabacteria-1]